MRSCEVAEFSCLQKRCYCIQFVHLVADLRVNAALHAMSSNVVWQEDGVF